MAAARSSWKGQLRFSLVTISVQAFSSSVAGQGEIHFNQLHSKCNSRIQYKKVCPLHGEVPKEEIVSGYEFSKGNYVVVDPVELNTLRPEKDKSISISTFVPAESIDPLYFDGRSYYLAPDGIAGKKPYAVLLQAMEKSKRWAIAQGVFTNREQLILVRPMSGMLGISMLRFESQVRQASDIDVEIPQSTATKQELALAETLIAASTDKKFKLADYHDTYTERLTQLIEAKTEGKEVVAPPQESEPKVINLMDALRRSVARAKKPSSRDDGQPTLEHRRKTTAAKEKRVKSRRRTA